VEEDEDGFNVMREKRDENKLIFEFINVEQILRKWGANAH
jgi:hypothetical protein